MRATARQDRPHGGGSVDHGGFRGRRVLPMRRGARARGALLRPEVQLLSRLVLVLAALVLVPTAAASAPAVARPSLSGGETSVETPGLVFFLAVDPEPGSVAVGTAHTFPVTDVTAAGRVDFFTGKSLRRVATSTRLYAPPGRPFSVPGATLRDDYLVYALEARPEDMRVLDASRQPVTRGTRVKVLGVPARGDEDEDTLYGTVAAVTEARLEVDLDLEEDLRGWGGAPILDSESGRVVGILQASVDTGGVPRLFAAPIGGVVDALEHPLESGTGRPLATFEGGSGDVDTPRPAAPAPTLAAGGGSRVYASRSEPTTLEMEVEYPPEGSAVASSTCGVFVAGRAAAHSGDLRSFDVVMVIDTSHSTIDPSGTDIDGDGKVGTQRLGRIGSIFMSSTDPGDSILAAEIAAARTLLEALDARNTRVGLVSFAGDPPGYGRQRRPAFTLEPLTREYDRIHEALDALLSADPEGATHMAAGVDQATIELLGLRGAISTPDPRSEKIVFFFTDGQPTLPYGTEAKADNVRAVLRAANRAGRGRIKIHSFAIGPDALDGPIAVVEMASRTDGYFTPVRDPGDLVSVVEEVSFANLDDMALSNETTRKAARYFRSTADGAWAGLVDLESGDNDIRVWARADDGAEIEQLRKVRLDPDVEESPPIPPELAARRNRLLEECLRDLKRLRMTAEEEQAEKVRRELLIEIEKEREKAQERADQQRKELELEGDVDEE